MPLSWLYDWLDPVPAVDPEALAERLTLQGLAVEAVERAGLGLEGAVAARAVAVDRHPRADHLWVVRLDAGAAQATVVTGAENVTVGAVCPWLPPGGRLPSGERMERRVFRGVVSEGMLLSAAEMGIGPDAGGIFLLSEDGAGPTVGTDVAQLLGLPAPVLDFDLTPNVATFGQSVLGLAREVAAAYGGGVRTPPALETSGSDDLRELPVQVRVEDPADCPQYHLALLSAAGLGRQRAPLAMRTRLLLAGMRLHGLAVDITNYVMWELGQPLHAFDFDRVRGSEVVVRRAREGEPLVTLDGTELVLSTQQLVIADGEGAMGLAGVMGGAISEVGPDTQRVLLEAAEFAPQVVRRSGRGVGLFSEAQSRFEKGVDPEGVKYALGRAIALFGEALGPGVWTSVRTAGVGGPPPRRRITLRPERVRRLLGTTIEDDEVAAALVRLGFRPDRGLAPWSVEVPSWRRDVDGEVDLVEEVARLVGYDRLPAHLPAQVPTVGARPAVEALSDALALALSAQGLVETLSSPLVARRDLERLAYDEADVVRLRNPLTADGDALRPSLLPGLLRTARLDLDRGREGVWIFDRGHVFARPVGPNALPREESHVAALLVGTRHAADWRSRPEPADFFALKGIVWPLLEAAYGPEGVGFTMVVGPGTAPGAGVRLHPGRSCHVRVDGREVAVLGELHPALTGALDLPSPVIYWEWSLTGVPERPQGVAGAVRLVRMPPAARDVACVLADTVSAAEALGAIRRAGGALLEDVTVFDVYRGAPVPEGHRSLAFRLRYRAEDRTLAEDEIERVHDRIRQALAALGGQLRS